MNFGIMYANAGPLGSPEVAGGLASLAEECGFESLWTVEHVVVPAGYESTYPYSDTGRMPAGEDIDIPDPLIYLSWVAAQTSRIRLATGILILPQRNPVILAKEVATLDRLSGGRMILGVGVGWLREEFDALGVPFEGRGRRTEEYVEALRVLWRAEAPAFDGEFVKFPSLYSNPKPLQPGGVPVVVGGHTLTSARRAGRIGDGYFPGRSTPEELVPLLGEMRRAATEAGRDPDTIEITVGGLPRDADDVAKYADLGVSRIAIPPLGFDLATLREQLPKYADSVAIS